MSDLLLPRTDGGVLIQFVAATIVFAAITWSARRRPEWRLLSIGAWLVTYGVMGVRAIH